MARVAINSTSWLNMNRLLSFEGCLFWDSIDFPEIPFSDDDVYLQLSDTDAKRIDLVAFRYYGDSDLDWVLLLANNKDLPNQFVGAETIRIPPRDTITRLLKQQL